MKYIPFFLLLIFVLTSCSKQPVEKKILIPVEKKKPTPIEREITGLIPETVIQKAEKKYGKYVRNRYEAFNEKLRELQNSSEELKLEEINNFFNNVPFVDDMKIWSQKDYWATPLEFLGKDKGDCEDFVIAKYFALRNLGIDSKKLYFSYVKSTRFKETHMVLSYFKTPDSIPLILDNINFKIFSADQRKDLTPIYNFNGESLYHTNKQGQNGQKVYKIWDKLIQDRAHKKWDILVNNIKKNKL
ncbi:MAG: transglutaminase-like cysteine peptidase [Sulfurimonas sp.]|nr:transglutaminase-like cysteine peptidase [Sulfurimonas sp.]